MSISIATLDIDFLDEYEKQTNTYLKIPKPVALAESEKAVLVWSEDFFHKDQAWIPKSQLRIDGENKLYVSDWFYQKL